MSTLATGVSKDDVVELQRPVHGGKSPTDEYITSNEVASETAQDIADMDRLGNKQELNRNFHSLSTLGLTCVIMGTWLGMIACVSMVEATNTVD